MFPLVVIGGLLRDVIKMVMIFLLLLLFGCFIFGEGGDGGALVESLWFEHEILNCFYLTDEGADLQQFVIRIICRNILSIALFACTNKDRRLLITRF